MPKSNTVKIEKSLKQALLEDGKMKYDLYECELADRVDDLKLSMKRDKEDYIFSIAENSGCIAMVLIEKPDKLYINEDAREKLKEFWKGRVYESNMRLFIPDFVRQLARNEIPIYGMKVARE